MTALPSSARPTARPRWSAMQMLHSSTAQALRFVLLMVAVSIIVGADLSVRQNLLLVVPSLMLNIIVFKTYDGQSADRERAGTIESGVIYLVLVLTILFF